MSEWLPTNPYINEPNGYVFEDGVRATAKKIVERLKLIWKDDKKFLEDIHNDVVKAVDEILKEIEES